MLPARSVRYYIARGLLDGPQVPGRGAYYTEEHLKRLQQIRAWQAEGLTLAQIAARLGGGLGGLRAQPQAWLEFSVGDGVRISVRQGMPPWRMRQVQAAIEEFARRLAETEVQLTEGS